MNKLQFHNTVYKIYTVHQLSSITVLHLLLFHYTIYCKYVERTKVVCFFQLSSVLINRRWPLNKIKHPLTLLETVVVWNKFKLILTYLVLKHLPHLWLNATDQFILVTSCKMSTQCIVNIYLICLWMFLFIIWFLSWGTE